MVILHSTHTYEVAQYLHCVCVHVCMFAGVQMYVCGIRACVWVGVTPVNCMCVWERLCVCVLYVAFAVGTVPLHTWQCVAVCCSVLQCVAVCCSVLQYVAECCSVLQCLCCGYCATSQGSLDWSEVDLSARPASSSTVQSVAVRCSVLQRVAGLSRFERSSSFFIHSAECCRVLQSVAVCCSVLQCVAACCKSL